MLMTSKLEERLLESFLDMAVPPKSSRLSHLSIPTFFDPLHPLPVVTVVGAIDQLELMTRAALAIPSGHPFIFTSTATSEDIKLWDIRSRALVYELATSNNTVNGLAWEQFANSLYAATSFLHSNVDNDYFLNHRPAKFPKQRSESNGATEDDSEDEEEHHIGGGQ
ncbi:hypothetical protein CPB83DRAFT_838602 [Crepidotus variabilis]|uniref:Uncharacterized protein n=1 Tax=Crepidotus variabilis TaxID=179855 RepID=A0A9P6E9B4_9AGAR|nr:hypothetical protein CPB83DRAFT_838602 [Crepidotus variabilis]